MILVTEGVVEGYVEAIPRVQQCSGKGLLDCYS